MAYTFSSLTAHFLKSVSFERIGRIQRQFVNQLCGVEERHVHQALWRTVTTARFNNRDHFATARNHFHFVATAQIARFRIQRVNKQDRFREGAVQFWYTASHTAGVPVLQNASGREPQVVLFIRCFRRRFEWQCEDHRFAIRFTVELIAFARFHVRVVTFAVTPLRFFTVHHLPAQTARFVVVIERCQIVTVTATKPCVLFEQPFLQMKPSSRDSSFS